MSRFDFVVIGSGPAGQKAAIQAAKCGRSVAVVELERTVGGACVFRGTIPSKTLRESAVRVSRMLRYGKSFGFELPERVELAPSMSRMHDVLDAHDRYIGRQLSRNNITRIHGRASLRSPNEIEIVHVDGKSETLTAETIILAVGSRPRTPENVPVDHGSV